MSDAQAFAATAEAIRNAAVFAATEAIRSGDWDRHLDQLSVALRERDRALHDRSQPPLRTAAMRASGHQVWVWLEGPGEPHWEIRGTGALLPTKEG